MTHDWFTVEAIAPGVTRIGEPFVNPYYSANLYFVRGRDRDLLVDAGMGILPLRPAVPETKGKPLLTVATHIHLDHVGGLHEFDERAGPRSEAALFETMPDSATYAHGYRACEQPVLRLPYEGWSVEDYRIQPAPLTRPLSEGDVIDLGDRVFRVLELPGHSPCVALLDEASGVFFAGDAIYDDELLDDMECSDRVAYRATMRRLLDEIEISKGYGGHGPSFDQARMHEIARGYLERTGGP